MDRYLQKHGYVTARVRLAAIFPLTGYDKLVDVEDAAGTFKRTVEGSPDPVHISTSYVERHNLTMRMSMRRFTRLTNAFSKKLQNLVYAVGLYTVWYNFCRVHRTLKTSPACATGLANKVHDAAWLVALIDAAAPDPPRMPLR